MKNLMKVLAAVIIVMAFSMSAMAQSTDNATITGNAIVVQGIEVLGVTDLDFGWVSPGLVKTIDLENTTTGGQIGEGNEETGVFSVSAAAGSDVQIQFTTLPTSLVYDTDKLLPIGTYTAGYHLLDPFDSGTTFAPGTGTQVSSGNFPTNDIGSSVNGIYVFIGATLTPGSIQDAGTYEADITLTATYN